MLDDVPRSWPDAGAAADRARQRGGPPRTADADITPARDPENLQRLTAALRELEARAELWNLVTSAGRLDVAFKPSGSEGYEDLVRNAVALSSCVRCFGSDGNQLDGGRGKIALLST
ncbi:MAG: hypothetical protein ACREXU_16815 [Gammaproteobacteria bacterium]